MRIENGVVTSNNPTGNPIAKMSCGEHARKAPASCNMGLSFRSWTAEKLPLAVERMTIASISAMRRFSILRRKPRMAGWPCSSRVPKKPACPDFGSPKFSL